MAYRAIFLDRDDTLIDDPGYISSPDQVKLLDGVPRALKELKRMGFKIVIVSNQSAVARGMITEQELAAIHKRLKTLLANQGAFVDNIYYSPYHPEGTVEKYRKNSNCRKPEPGMLLKASEQMDLELQTSWMIGDSIRDVQAGRKVGCKTILLEPVTHEKKTFDPNSRPDYQAVNITEAVNIIKHYERENNRQNIIAENPITPEPQKSPTSSNTESRSEKPEPDLKPEKSENPHRSESNSHSGQHQTLNAILEHLQNEKREKMFDEFSILRLLAGMIQVLAVFCVIFTIWLLMGKQTNYNSVFTSLGLAAVLQLMSLNFFMMK